VQDAPGRGSRGRITGDALRRCNTDEDKKQQDVEVQKEPETSSRLLLVSREVAASTLRTGQEDPPEAGGRQAVDVVARVFEVVRRHAVKKDQTNFPEHAGRELGFVRMRIRCRCSSDIQKAKQDAGSYPPDLRGEDWNPVSRCLGMENNAVPVWAVEAEVAKVMCKDKTRSRENQR